MTQQEYENKIKESEQQIEKLKQQIKELKLVKVADKGGRWRPELDEWYWTVYDTGRCGNCNWDNDSIDKWRYLTGNCFKTEEEAEEYRKQIEYTARYKNYIEEHSEPIYWNNGFQWKYYAIVNCNKGEIDTDESNNWKRQGVIYASSKQVIEDAIKEIGEDNFKKYVLGVK